MGFATPAQCIMHRASGSEHGTCRIDGIASLAENLRASCRRQGFPCDGNPVLTMQYGFVWLALCL